MRQDHPIAALFPLMSDTELDQLAADIKTNGQRIPVVLHEGKILDGRNRARACALAGVDPRYEDWSGDGDPIEWVISVNLHRRHLNETQRAMVGARAKGLFEEAAKERQEEGRSAGGKSKAGRAQICAEARPRKAAADAAALASISPRSVESASRVLSAGVPALAAACDSGKIAVSLAADVSKLPAPEQKRIVALVEDGKKPKQAVAQVTRERIVERAAVETKAVPAAPTGLVRDLAAVAGRYRTIYVDPPWEYENAGMRGAAAQHYPTMSLADLSALPVGDLAHAEGAHLWLWTTWPMIRDGAPHEILDAWGFVERGRVEQGQVRRRQLHARADRGTYSRHARGGPGALAGRARVSRGAARRPQREAGGVRQARRAREPRPSDRAVRAHAAEGLGAVGARSSEGGR